MNWTKETAPSGTPRWQGVCSVQDPHRKAGSERALAASLIGACVGGVLGGLTDIFGGALLGVFFGALAGLVIGADEDTPNFDTRAWALSADALCLSYQAAASAYLDAARWSVRLDQIARIETGRTVEWQAGRDYGRYLGQRVVTAPSAEYQAFLFLTDGSRRVFHTVNADREDAETLAHSVRAWLEARKKEAAAQSGHFQICEGFDV